MGNLDDRIKSTIEHFQSRIELIHGVTVNPGLIESVRVPYQGQNVPISEIGFTSKNGKFLEVQVYDPELVGVVTSTLQKQGHSVYSSKNVVRVSIPIASAETREKNKKRVNELAEEAKVAIRRIRQECRKQAIKSTTSEDDKERIDKEIQATVDKGITRIDTLAIAKNETL